MSGIAAPQTNPIAQPAAPTPPRRRAMDTYDPPVDSAFTAKENSFFNTHPHDKDDVVNMLSPFGFFKIESYPNQGNPNDTHYVVFFYNRATQETYEVHGTIALFYINSVRNNSNIQDFSISDSRQYRANTQDGISYFSQYSLRWEQATNNVIKKYYKPYDPAQAAVASKLHDYDPLKKDTLVGYSEEYTIASNALNYNNWKDEPDLGKYNGSIGIRNVGMPSQILLHETAGLGDLSIPNVRQETTPSGHTYFPIPHFCVNNQDAQDKGNIVQFVDLATNVPHGEITNQRAIGIEFVNAPIEAFKVDADGHVLQPPQPVFNLEKSEKGLYLKTKLGGLARLFIPLEFSTDTGGAYYELALRKDRLLNFTTLKAGIGAPKKKILTEDGDNILIKYAKSDKFEHLATLVSSLVTNKLVRNLDNLSNGNFWKPVVQVADKRFYLFQHGWEKRTEGTYFFTDIREPGVLTHLLIGGHVDGGLQGLYLYLKFVRQVPTEAILQLMIGFLTSDKTAAETAKIKLKSKVLLKNDALVDPATPIEKEFADVLELDETMISAVTVS
jgi:hypothetical protein